MAGISTIFSLTSANDDMEVCLDLTEIFFFCDTGFEPRSSSQIGLGTSFGTTLSDTISKLRFTRNVDGKIHNLA